MELLGVLLGFITILTLNSKDINMGISLLVGAVVAGLFSQMGLQQVAVTILQSVVEPVSLQLIIVVAVISGIGYMLKKTGDLNRMIDSLIGIIKNGKVLSMMLPALIGTLSVPGGAILSAPMVKESGDRISLSQARKTASNLFFRHIFLFGYPLYGALILTGKLFEVEQISIIKYNILIMLVGITAAYFAIFNNEHQEKANEYQNNEDSLGENIIAFLSSFSPILIIIVLAIGFKVPFHFAVFAGLFLSIGRNLTSDNLAVEYMKRIKEFYLEGINYKMAFVIIGVMAFKSIVEGSGAVEVLAEFLSNTGIPLSLMMVALGLITGYLTGMTMAAMGILAPIFIPLIPSGAAGSYISLLFTSAFVGYLISPIHLCFALTKEYFEVSFKPVYKLMFVPGIAMIGIALLQVII